MTDPTDLPSQPDSQFDHQSHDPTEQQPHSQRDDEKQQPEASSSTPPVIPPSPSAEGKRRSDTDTGLIMSLVLSILSVLDTYVLPPHLRAMILSTAASHPLLTTFLLCQFVCSCIPLGMFLAGATIAAGIAVVMFSCVALLVLGPVLIATTVAGIILWGWGWAVFMLGRWFVRYLDEVGDENRGRGGRGLEVSGMGGRIGEKDIKEEVSD